MSLFSAFRFVNGSAWFSIRTPIQRETNQTKRTDGDNYLYLPLEEKAFEGLLATTAQGITARGEIVALTGQAATTAQGTLSAGADYDEWKDSFTDGNGTNITSHYGDAPDSYGWNWPYGTYEPQITSNRLYMPVTGNDISLVYNNWLPTVAAENDFTLDVTFYKANSTAGATTGIVNTGVFVRGSTYDTEGYVIGWNELDGTWYINRLDSGNVLTNLGSYGDTFSNSTSRTIRIRIWSYASYAPYYDVYIGVKLNVNDTYDTFYGYDYGTTFGGLAYTAVGAVFEEAEGVYIDAIRAWDPALKRLAGFRATATAGDVNKLVLTGLAATTGYGAFSFGTSAEVTLTGQAATTAYGTITPELGAIIVELTGEDATTAYGTVVPAFSVLCEPSFSFNPHVAWTYKTDANAQNPGNIGTQFLPWKGTLYGAGNAASETTFLLYPRSGFKKINQVTQETNPWTSNFTFTTSDITGMSIDNPADPNLIGDYFPRGFFGEQNPGPRFNTIYSKGGWVSITAGGNLWSAVERVYDKMGSVSVFLAPHSGDIQTVAYNGPELHTGTVQSALVTDPLRQRYQNAAPMGIFPLSDSEALGFYPQIIDGYISGKFADLVGHRATTRWDPLTAGYTSGSNPEIPLVGLAAVTASSPSSFVNDVALSGRSATAQGGILYARDANVVPAFRRLSNGAWGTETVASSFSGAGRSWVRSGYMTAVPSGYGDLTYVVYYSEGWANVGPKIGVLVLDASAGTVISNTLYDTASTPFTAVTNGNSLNGQTLDNVNRPWGLHRTVALVHKLGSGTSVTQFLFCGEVVHLSWTSASRTAPTVTIKNGVSLSAAKAVYSSWDSLEVRGNSVYHVVPAGSTLFYYGGYDGGVETLYVNDATGTGSSWTTPTLASSTSGTKDTERDSPIFYGGYGGGNKTYWYLSWWDYVGVQEGNDSGWFDAWYQQQKPISLETVSILSRVRVTVDDANKTAALSGLAATTAQGTLYASITYQRQLTGEVATTAYGIITPEGGDVIGALSGQVATTTHGTITPSLGGADVSIGLVHGHIDTHFGVITIPIVGAPGLAAVTASGVLGLAIDQAPEQTGLVGYGLQGAIAPEVAASLIGEGATGAIAAPLPQISAPVWSWGLYSAALAGALGRFAEDLAALSGNAAVTQQGDLAPVSFISVALDGQDSSGSAGELAPSVAVVLVGGNAALRQGNVQAVLTYGVAGQAATTQYGSLQAYLFRSLDGNQATGNDGIIGYQTSGSVVVYGLAARLQLGDATRGFKKPSYDRFLWAVRHVDESFVQEIPDEDAPVVAPNE